LAAAPCGMLVRTMIRLEERELAGEIEALTGERVADCNQCGKCTAGCPMAPDMDLSPNQIMRSAQLGLTDRVLRCRAIWLCASCETCATRCPMKVSLAAIVDVLRQMACRRGLADRSTHVPQFHEAFLASVGKHGRAHELGLILSYKLRARRLFDDMALGLRMLREGKLKLFPDRIRGRDDVSRILRRSRGHPER